MNTMISIVGIGLSDLGCTTVKELHRAGTCCENPATAITGEIGAPFVGAPISGEYHLRTAFKSPFQKPCEDGSLYYDHESGLCRARFLDDSPCQCGLTDGGYFPGTHRLDESGTACVKYRNASGIPTLYSSGAIPAHVNSWSDHMNVKPFTYDFGSYISFPVYSFYDGLSPPKIAAGQCKEDADGTQYDCLGVGDTPKGTEYGDVVNSENVNAVLGPLYLPVPYSAEHEMRALTTKYPGMFPNDGVGYYMSLLAGGSQYAMSATLLSQMVSLVEENTDAFDKFCVFVHAPTYVSPDISLLFRGWNSEMAFHPHFGARPVAFQTSWTNESAVQFVVWKDGDALPTCTNKGVDYLPDSTSPTSPWLQLLTWPDNPTGERKAAHVPGGRLHVDAAYNAPQFAHREGLTKMPEIVRGTDGEPPMAMYYSGNKWIYNIAARFCWITMSDKSAWKTLWNLATNSFHFYNRMQVEAFVHFNKYYTLGFDSEFETLKAAHAAKWDAKMIAAVPPTCPYVEWNNLKDNGKFMGGYMTMRLKDGYKKTSSSAANEFIHIGEYLKKVVKVTVKAHKYRDASGNSLAGNDDFYFTDYGGTQKPHSGTTFADMVRLNTWNGDDEQNQELVDRISKICSGAVPDPKAAAEADASLVISESS